MEAWWAKDAANQVCYKVLRKQASLSGYTMQMNGNILLENTKETVNSFVVTVKDYSGSPKYFIQDRG